MAAFDEEIFGPVAPITTFRTDEEAIALANQTEYGLSAAVHSASLDRARNVARRLRTGMVHINDQTVNDDARAPFGGVGASGNGSRRAVTLHLTSTPRGTGRRSASSRQCTRFKDFVATRLAGLSPRATVLLRGENSALRE